MPIVQNPKVLAEIYAKAKARIDARDVPTAFVEPGQVLYRSIPDTVLPKPAAGGHVSKAAANKLLMPFVKADANRFSGTSGGAIPPAEGLYCVLQQQALVNESTHYSGKAPKWALAGKCVIRIRVMARMLVADLSPHNPRALRFFRELGRNVWERVNDSVDCSVARGIGLAVAHSGYLSGLIVQTVRESDRSVEERGDNLVLFPPPGRPVEGVYIDEAYYYGKKRSAPEIFPVAFP